MKKIHIILFSSILLFACSKEAKTEKKPDTGFMISNTMMKTTTMAEAKNEFVKDELQFFGKISADKNQYIDVYPLVGGNVLNVFVSLGDYVQKGQPLATIRSTEIAGFQRDLGDAKTNVVVAENALRIAKEMYAGKLSTEKEVLEAKSQLQKAHDELRRAQQVSEIYNVKNGNIYTITSPISGYIVQKSINKGMELRSDRSDNVFDVANTTNVWAMVNVNESDISKITVGMQAQVSTIVNPGVIFPGTIDKIVKVIDPATNSMQARVVLNNVQGVLIPESKATIKVLKTEDTTAISIPTKALIFDNNRYFVVVYKSQSDVKVHEVTVSSQTDDQAFISKGLSAGDKVITNNQLLIYRALNQ
ncbi:MAG: efflux RND transporter periplasmic adaptor subunit [Bacteroidetes bacterium]|nr:efflux RND transporter periplasmic adaptor subunit [Bacteroidota bacterium]